MPENARTRREDENGKWTKNRRGICRRSTVYSWGCGSPNTAATTASAGTSTTRMAHRTGKTTRTRSRSTIRPTSGVIVS